jgi:hypothetical protein
LTFRDLILAEIHNTLLSLDAASTFYLRGALTQTAWSLHLSLTEVTSVSRQGQDVLHRDLACLDEVTKGSLRAVAVVLYESPSRVKPQQGALA